MRDSVTRTDGNGKRGHASHGGNRKAVSFAGASSGSIVSDADVSWTNISGSQDATFFTAWDALTDGSFLFSGTITGNPYTAGDTYTISSGSFTTSLTLAS